MTHSISAHTSGEKVSDGEEGNDDDYDGLTIQLVSYTHVLPGPRDNFLQNGKIAPSSSPWTSLTLV